MISANQYVCAEPEKVVVYADNKGDLHKTRDDAIDASFQHDFSAACEQAISKMDDMPVLLFRLAVENLVRQNPDILRVMIGDRDAT
jgi:hypothetical protein